MKPAMPEYSHIEGKTYTLFEDSDSTEEYYNTIRNLADRASAMQPDTGELITKLQKFSARKRSLRRALKKKREGSPSSLLSAGFHSRMQIRKGGF
jgi:hypothetical protein